MGRGDWPSLVIGDKIKVFDLKRVYKIVVHCIYLTDQ